MFTLKQTVCAWAVGLGLSIMTVPAIASTEYYSFDHQNHLQQDNKNCNTDSAHHQPTYHSPFRPYELNYVIPLYYTGSPAPGSEIIKSEPNKKIETKFQLSVQTELIHHIMHQPISLNFFYTQFSYWQFYNESAYFRETNYNPGLFFRLAPTVKHLPFKLYSVNLGVMHQSNGRGSDNERSWNRIYAVFNFQFGPHWLISVRPWYRVQHLLESKDYNPDIKKYLGDGDIRINYSYNNFLLSLMLRNEAESGFKRGAEELNASFPFYHHLHGFVQLFSGYGQSLIAYNHYTNGAGVGLSIFTDHQPGLN